MKRIWLALAGTVLLSALVVPVVVNAQFTGGPNECAKLLRDATEIADPQCSGGNVVGYDENFDGKITCDKTTIAADSWPAVGRCQNDGVNDVCNIAGWGACSLVSTVKFVVDFVFWAFMLIAVAVFAWAGFTIMTAQGDPEKFGQGRRFVTYAVIGVLVAIGSRFLPAIVRGIIGY